MTQLKIKASDADDLSVISACLQDTAIRESDMVWEPTQHRFGFVGQRYMWEAKNGPRNGQRINCRVWVDGVQAAQRRGMDGPDNAFDLLAITTEAGAITLHFAGGAAARLQLLQDWRVYLEDFGPAWPCPACPTHAEKAQNT